jgi:ferredoxin
MKVLKTQKENLSGLLDKLKNAYRLYGPVRQGDMFSFVPLQDTSQIDLSFQNSRLSPKSLFLPQSDRLFEYSLDAKRDDAHILKEVEKDYSPRAVIGIRPCDARAFTLVDVNFDAPDFRDPWWLKARDCTTLVGLGCTTPCSTCFCTSVGGGPFDEEGLDVLLINMGETLLAKVLTQKGEQLIEASSGFEMADEGLVEMVRTIEQEAQEKVVSTVDTSKLADIDTLSLYGADFWEAVHFSCINCGICTYLCPTCWCFDIQDETYGRAGHRIRNWDACMFPLFTLHASGHNPRGQKVDRVRQRFMHKLKYYVDTYKNGVACVGCGRCVQHCPVNIDIREVIRLMNEYGEK